MTGNDKLADLFAALWQRLAEDLRAFEASLVSIEARREDALITVDMLDALLSAHAAADSVDRLEAWIANDSNWTALERTIFVAQAIDRWHEAVFPITAEEASGQRGLDLARARHNLYKLGRLNIDEALGSVIPKRPRWGRWSDPDLELPEEEPSIWDAFKYLLVAPLTIEATDADDANRKKRKVRLCFRMLDPTTLRRSEVDWVPKIGFAPIAEQQDDIDVRFLEAESRHWYDARARDLQARAAEAIERLCADGVHIIVFPEMVVHPDALPAIQKAIAAFGPSSQLRLVLAGTTRQPDAGRPFNEAVLFNHRGEEIGRQRKLHRWNLADALRRRYGFQPDGLNPADDLFEYITPGEDVLILEQVQFGRLAVMICEDLGRSEPGQWLREHMLLDWLLTPILDSSIGPHRWMSQKGSSAALGGRCRVVVANSLPMTHWQNAENRRAGDAANVVAECGVGICLDLERGKVRYRLVSVDLASSKVALTTFWEPSDWQEIVIVN